MPYGATNNFYWSFLEYSLFFTGKKRLILYLFTDNDFSDPEMVIHKLTTRVCYVILSIIFLQIFELRTS